MQPHCLRHTEIPGTTDLFRDFVYHFDRVAPFYSYNPFHTESYAEAARKLAYPRGRRQALVSALRARNGPSPLLDRLAQPETVAVVTGQQVGLFSGPCYTIYKALTAVKLAGHLTAQGIPAVPIFWLATEDHDFEEVNHAWSFDAHTHPLQFQVTADNPDHRPAGTIAPAAYPTAALRESLAGLPFADEVAALVDEAYQPGVPMGAAFGALLRKLLPGIDLLYIDPLDPDIRALAAPLLREAIPAAGLLSDRLLERSRLLEHAGYHAQVHLEPKTSLFFLLDKGSRITLRRNGDTYTGAAGQWTAAELAARADHVSPNALLRPVVQDYLLPTVAQIGGPAELAYLAQTQVIYQTLGCQAPVVVPRSAFTLLDSRAAKLLDRYNLSPRDTFDGLEPLQQTISRTLVPPETISALQRAKETTLQALSHLESSLAGFDNTLAAATAKSRAKIFYQLSKIEAKTARQALLRDERASGDAAYLHNLIYPNRHLQERLYTILPFLARHGLDLPHRLAEKVRLECPDHILFPI